MLASKRAIVVITGASRGIGREIAMQVSSIVSSDSTMILMARSLDALEVTKKDIKNLTKVHTRQVDLSSSMTAYTSDIACIVCDNLKDVEVVAIFHNAGTIGNLRIPSDSLNNADDWHCYLQTNFVSAVLLNNAIFGEVKNLVVDEKIKFLAVDITSLMAIVPYPSLTQYGIGKASREAFFRSFALENPKARVLSYSPGPVDTNMRAEVAAQSFSDEARQAFKKLPKYSPDKPVLTCKQTVEQMIKIIEENKFKNGSRVDFFD